MEALRWQIVFDTGWTLEQVDALTLGEMKEYLQVKDGMAKGRNSLLRNSAARKGK